MTVSKSQANLIQACNLNFINQMIQQLSENFNDKITQYLFHIKSIQYQLSILKKYEHQKYTNYIKILKKYYPLQKYFIKKIPNYHPIIAFPLQKMQLTNIASKKHKCKILHVSSSDNKIVHPIQSIINEDKDSNVWISGEGLPQQIILSFQNVEFQYQAIKAFVFNCSHDYETNPKVVEIWIAKDVAAYESSEWIFWEKLELKKKRGNQMFFVSNIPESQRIVKVVITETFGEYHTYLNQIMVMAEPDPQTSQSLFNNQQWQKLQKKSLQPHKKSMHKSRTAKNILRTKSSGIKDQDLNQYLPQMQNSPLQLLKDVQNFEQNKNRKKGRKLQLDDIHDPMPDRNQSIETDTVLLAMSKNILIMEDNIEELKRKFQIIQKKVQYTYENFENNLMKRVEQLIDQKMERKFSQKELPVQGSKRLRSCKDLTTSRTMNRISGSRAESKDREKLKEKQREKHKGKYDEAYSHQNQQKIKQKKVMSLVAELNNKLKQRTKLANKLQKRLKIGDKPKSEYYD